MFREPHLFQYFNLAVNRCHCAAGVLILRICGDSITGLSWYHALQMLQVDVIKRMKQQFINVARKARALIKWIAKPWNLHETLRKYQPSHILYTETLKLLWNTNVFKINGMHALYTSSPYIQLFLDHFKGISNGPKLSTNFQLWNMRAHISTFKSIFQSSKLSGYLFITC